MPELFVTAGADAGRVFALTNELTRLGRHGDNEVVLDDSSVSRFHAHVFRRADRYYVRDVASTKGTFVNGVRLTGEVLLRDGDAMRVGQTELVFRLEKAAALDFAAPSNQQAQLLRTCVFQDRAEPLDDKSIMFSIPIAASPAEAGLSSQRLGVLSRIATAIQSISDLEELLGTLLDATVELFHHDRGVILLCDTPGGPLVPKLTRPEQGEFVISRTVLDHAIQNRMSLLVANAMADVRFSGAMSIVSQSIRAVICSPLICKEKVLGAIYVDAEGELAGRQHDDVAMLNLIAANAAIAIENAILIREKIAATRLASDDPGPVLAQSAAMRKVQERIAELGRGRAPILVVGDRGTGKLFAAKTLHKAAREHDAPFLQMDCSSLVEGEGCKAIFGSDGTDLPAGAPGDGLWRRAAGGTLVLRHVDRLDRPTQECLARQLEAHAQGDKAVPDTRIIATVSEDPGRLTKDGRVLAPLAERLAEKTLFMPRLRDRKEDILPLARYFLSRSDQRAGEPKHQFNRSAERLLGSLQYRHGNVAELQEAVEFAAVIAGGAEIGAEHIFTGPKDKGQPVEYDLGQTPLVPWLSRRTVVNVLQTLVLLLFLGIALACLAAGGTLVGQVANGLVWGLWWPALMILFLFVGRVWCPFCPISKVGRIFRAIGGLDRAPPERLKKHTGWIMALLFFAVIWSEHVFGMTGSPAATGILLLTLMACCAAVSVVHSRDAWCRYLCPLGSLSAGYAVASPTHVHSIPSVCGTQCKTQECFKGSASDPGCPMFHHPLYVRDAHFCKVCLTCVRVCPNQSARLYLRPPLQAIWRSGELSPTLIPLCLVASLLALVMLASQRAGWGVDGAIGFTVAGGLVLAVSFTVAAILPRLLSRDGNVGVASRAMLALLLLGWGPLMAFHIANIPGLETLRIHATPDSFWTRLVPSLDLSLVTVLQFGAVLFAAVVGGITLWRIRVHMTRQDAEIVPWGWNAFLAAATVYLTVSICLVILGKPTP